MCDAEVAAVSAVLSGRFDAVLAGEMAGALGLNRRVAATCSELGAWMSPVRRRMLQCAISYQGIRGDDGKQLSSGTVW